MNNTTHGLNTDFNYDFVPASLAQLTKKIYTVYCQIDTHEIWNYETLTRTSTQITYYYELGIINEVQANELQNRLIDLCTHLEIECATGKMFLMDHEPLTKDENYRFYFNEIIAADNSIYAEYNGIKESFLPHIVLNYMTTDNEVYSNFNKSVFDNVINKSTLITKVNEKDRKRNFLITIKNSFNSKFKNRTYIVIF